MAVKVRQRKGRWWVMIDHRGKRKARCVGDKRIADRVADTIRAKLALGDAGFMVDKKSRPFDQYWNSWLTSYARLHCKQSTVEGYASVGRLYLVPAFGSRDVGQITRDDVKALVQTLDSARNRKDQPLAWGTIKAVLATLREMFNHAVEDGHVASNPALRILRRTRREAQARRAPEAEFLTQEELAELLRACRDDFPRFYPFVLTLARTGMRLGEVLGLRWADIDWRSRFGEVRRSIVQGRVETPKSGKGRRVDLSLQLVETLRAHHVEQRKNALAAGEPSPVEVFPNLDANNFRRREWARMLQKSGLRHVPIKALRHTFASLHIAQGESLAYVRDQLGHHSIQITVDHYGHLVPGGNRAAADRLDDVLSKQPSATPAQPAVG